MVERMLKWKFKWAHLEVLRSWSRTQTLQLFIEGGENDEHDENHGC